MSTEKIKRANLDGTNITDLVTGLNTSLDAPKGITIHNNQIYWTDSLTDKIQRADLDSSSNTTTNSSLGDGTSDFPLQIGSNNTTKTK